MLTQHNMLAHAQTLEAAVGVDESSVSMVAMPLFHVGGSSWCAVHAVPRRASA